jgi:hypothetical protein
MKAFFSKLGGALVAAAKALFGALAEGLLGVLRGRKFQMAVINSLCTAGLGLGLELNPETVAMIVGPLWVALVGQAGADFGKEGKKTMADALIEAAKLGLIPAPSAPQLPAPLLASSVPPSSVSASG